VFAYTSPNSAGLCLIFFNLCCGTLSTAASTGLMYQPRMIGEGDCGEIGGTKIDRGNQISAVVLDSDRLAYDTFSVCCVHYHGIRKTEAAGCSKRW
jgi:hypothetical protein